MRGWWVQVVVVARVLSEQRAVGVVVAGIDAVVTAAAAAAGATATAKCRQDRA
jgi:hypothetical protein